MVNFIKGVAEINEAHRKREETVRQTNQERAKKKAADAEAQDGSMKEILKKAAEAEGPLLPAPVLPSEDQGPGLPDKVKAVKPKAPAPRRVVKEDGGGAFMPGDNGSREEGRRTIKGAGFRGNREVAEESQRPDGRRTIKGAGYRAKEEDQRGGLARSGSKQQAAEAKAEQLSVKAAEAVLKFLPSIYQALKEIPIH